MARIEEKTSDSIRSNGELLLSITRERIWEEFIKSWEQSKDFNEYLKYLDDFNLYQYIFPGAEINSARISTQQLPIILANLFLTDDRSKLEQILVLNYKIESNLAKKVVFLIHSLTFEGPEILSFYRSKGAKGVSDELLKEWWGLMGYLTEPIFVAFFKYQPSVLAEDLMKIGLKGKMLGDKLNELEFENFKKLY